MSEAIEKNSDEIERLIIELEDVIDRLKRALRYRRKLK